MSKNATLVVASLAILVGLVVFSGLRTTRDVTEKPSTRGKKDLSGTNVPLLHRPSKGQQDQPNSYQEAARELAARFKSLESKLRQGNDVLDEIEELETSDALRLVHPDKLRDMIRSLDYAITKMVLLIMIGRVAKAHTEQLLLSFTGDEDIWLRLASIHALAVAHRPLGAVPAQARESWKFRLEFIRALEHGFVPPLWDAVADLEALPMPSIRKGLMDRFGLEGDGAIQKYVLIALAHSSRFDDVANWLAQIATSHPDAGLRHAAVRALGYAKSDFAASTLRSIIKKDGDEDVRIAAIVALGASGKDADTSYLSDLATRGASIGERRAAIQALGGNPSVAIQQTLYQLATEDRNPVIASDALNALAKTRSALAFDALCRCARNGQLFVKVAAIKNLGESGDKRAIPILEECAKSEESESIQLAAKEALKTLRSR